MTDFSTWKVTDDINAQGRLYMNLQIPGAKSPVPMPVDVIDRIMPWETRKLADELAEAAGIYVSNETAEALIQPDADGVSPLQRMAFKAEQMFALRQEMLADYGTEATKE